MYLKALQEAPIRLDMTLSKLYEKYEVEEDEETRIKQWQYIKQLESEVASQKKKSKAGKESLSERRQHYHIGNGPYDIGIKGVDFFRLPHKV